MRNTLISLLVLACAQVTFGTDISGALNGILGPGTYHVVGDISIESGDSLTLQPGTIFHFDGPYPFRIYGTLLAEGTESDSIVFTTEQSGSNRWQGLRFYSGSSGSRLAYCLIEKGLAIDGYPNTYGGGVFCNNSSPSFAHCTISNNSASFGAGVFCEYYSAPSFTNCLIASNSASNCGGGVLCNWYSSPSFTNCAVSGNWASSCAGGVYFSNSSPTLMYCTISGNSAGDTGGGAYFSWDSSPTFTNCTLSDNWAFNGGGVYCYGYCSPLFTNCTLSNNAANTGGGVYCGYSSLVFNSTIIAFSNGSGIYFEFEDGAGSQVSYCDFFGNSAGNFAFYNDDPSNGPTSIGELVTTNSNGDSCDQYNNIFLDPLLADTAASDFHLDDYSPCIGAADPTDPPPFDMDGNPRPNPPGSLPDIGAYEHWRDIPLPVEMTTFQAVAGDGQVTLHWQTASELNNDHFVLYKRKTGEEDFHRLTEIPGHGTTAEPHDYQFVDSWVQNGTTYEYQISDVDIAGRETFYEHIVSTTPGRDAMPTEFALHQNYPNPFNPVTTIRYDVKEAGLVSLKIFDLLGREVTTLTHEEHSAGSYSMTWDAAGMPSGIYLCRMEAEGFAQVRKLLLVK